MDTPTMESKVSESLTRLLRNLGSDVSRRSYMQNWTRFRVWLELEGIDLLEVKPRHIEDHIIYLQNQGNTRSTCGHALSVIRAVYGILVRDEIVLVNPAREVKNPKFDSSPKTPYLNEEQIGKILSIPAKDWTEKRDHLCVCLLFGLGWRRTEIANLQYEDFVDKTVTGIVKGRKRLTVGVPDWLLVKILDWQKFSGISTGPLLPRAQDDSDAVSGDIVYKIVKRAAKQAGVICTPHSLRRTNITLARERGVSLKALQLAVGHISQSTTERYDRARDAAKNAPGDVFEDLVTVRSDGKK